MADSPTLETDGIEIFATGTTSIATGTDQFVPHDVGELVRRGGASLHDGYDRLRELQARPGHRPGVSTSGLRSARRGESDVVRPVAVNPGTASAAAVSGALFVGTIPHLRVEHDDRDGAGAELLVWQSTVTHGRGRGVPATLHLLASPSMVVTVLELVPQRRVRWNRRRFLRDGIAALDALAARLEVAGRRPA